jgi:hypothetical protein
MFGILILIAIYAVLGFLLSWIANMVAKDDIEVKTSVIIIVLWGVLNTGSSYALNAADLPGASWLASAIGFGLLVALLHFIAHLAWKHCLIIAAIYSVIMLGISMLLS